LCHRKHYPDGDNHVYADCGHEWVTVASPGAVDAGIVVRDVNGNLIAWLFGLNRLAGCPYPTMGAESPGGISKMLGNGSTIDPYAIRPI
jgi:hypothetical protein